MQRIVWTALLTLTGAAAQPPAPLPRAYIGHLASGGGWKTTLTLFNPTATQNAVSVTFRADDGSALSLPLVITQGGARQAGAGSEVSRTLQPLATLVIESEAPAASDVLTGWADVVSRGAIAGSAIFRRRDPDGRTVEGVAPLDPSNPSSLVVSFDNREGAATGIALVNPTASPVQLIVRVRNENGIELDQQRLPLAASGHAAFAIGDLSAASAGQQGTFEVVSPVAARVTGLGFRFSASGGFTSVPVWHLAQALATQP